jgi:hypothetical protein
MVLLYGDSSKGTALIAAKSAASQSAADRLQTRPDNHRRHLRRRRGSETSLWTAKVGR